MNRSPTTHSMRKTNECAKRETGNSSATPSMRCAVTQEILCLVYMDVRIDRSTEVVMHARTTHDEFDAYCPISTLFVAATTTKTSIHSFFHPSSYRP